MPSFRLAGKYLKGYSLKVYGGQYNGESHIHEDWKHHACLMSRKEKNG